MHLKKRSDAAPTTATLVAEDLGTSGAHDATLSSGGAELSCEGSRDAQLSLSGAVDLALPKSDGEKQAHKLQIEVEQLRKVLSDAEHAKLELHAQNERLQADLLARYVHSVSCFN